MTEFARQLSVNPDQVRQWRHGYDGRRPGADSCVQIELVTVGAVTCEVLRPDLVWRRVPSRKWPHPKGKPLLDVLPEAA